MIRARISTVAVASSLRTVGLALAGLALAGCMARPSPPPAASAPSTTHPGAKPVVTDLPFCADPYRDLSKPCIASK